LTTGNAELISHLYRRAGFGISNAELNELKEKKYEDIVEDLLHPGNRPEFSLREWHRYNPGDGTVNYENEWIFRMTNSERPLEEKMSLLWHHIFATGYGKIEHPLAMGVQIDTFRKICMLDFRTILIELSKDPAMMFWLDNNENHKSAPNENYGRELLELFSMGVGNYTEDDIKNASRAFTGWTFTQPVPIYPQGAYPTEHEFVSEDHDYSEKTFLGKTGNFNGEDIIDIIVGTPACAKFIARHFYNFFVADEYQVPAWNENPPKDPEAVELLANTFSETKGDIKEVLRVLFNSEFFKEARFKKVKSPIEFVIGVLRFTGEHQDPSQPSNYQKVPIVMGQEITNPPTVEGWHTGTEWLDAGTLSERINFAVQSVSDENKPGIKILHNETSNQNDPQKLLQYCLDQFGGIEISGPDKESIIQAVAKDESKDQTALIKYLQCIVSSPEYQMA